jgi:hypothetical protein
VQILTPREPPKEIQVKYCSNCNKRVQWLERSRRFICYSCGVTYSELYDKPLSSLDQTIRPLQGEGSNNKPALFSIPINKRLEGEHQSETIEQTRSYQGGRIRHIRLKPGISPAAYNIHEELENERE